MQCVSLAFFYCLSLLLTFSFKSRPVATSSCDGESFFLSLDRRLRNFKDSIRELCGHTSITNDTEIYFQIMSMSKRRLRENERNSWSSMGDWVSDRRCFPMNLREHLYVCLPLSIITKQRRCDVCVKICFWCKEETVFGVVQLIFFFIGYTSHHTDLFFFVASCQSCVDHRLVHWCFYPVALSSSVYRVLVLARLSFIKFSLKCHKSRYG